MAKNTQGPAAPVKKTPMMVQFDEAKSEHPDKILFFRMGDFYEMFFDDAVKASQLLGLTLTSRSKDEDNPIPMAGVPHHQCERYLKELISLGQKVAICDQLEDPAQAKGIVKRGITRVVTPGTVLDDACLQSHTNNFLIAVCFKKETAGLATVDLSTGEFFVSSLTEESLGDEIDRLSPAETLVPSGQAQSGPLSQALKFRAVGTLSEREDYSFHVEESEKRLREHFGVKSLDGFGLQEQPAAVAAAGAALEYLQETQKTNLAHIRSLRWVERGAFLLLDRATQRNLELTHSRMEGGRKGSLLSVLDRTRTGPGGRMLRGWLLRPLCDLLQIQRRQEAVRELMEDHLLRTELREILSAIADMERIMARVITGRASGRDLSALRDSAEKLPVIQHVGESMRAPILTELAAQIDTLDDVRGAIAEALVDEPPLAIKDGGLIRSGFHPELDELRQISSGGKDWIASFQTSEQQRTGIPSLKVGFNRVFGYYIEITNAHKDKAPSEYERKQTLVNAERYIVPALKEYEQKVLGAEERIGALEYELFYQLRESVALQVERVQQVAAALATLDALASLAETGAVQGYIMPALDESLETRIEAGRHPVLETMLPDGEFVANDIVFDPESSRVMIITGPNMAGKSTYIRQAALLAILAQMGCGVPAASAKMGLVDRIFTRVGAADDLARGQSTFMVEMAETANILNNATERSLLILDEVGRGTSTFDGVSLAWSITEYLHAKIGARTMFATHYHELAELGVILEKAKNFNVAVRDWGGEVIFLHRIQPGSTDRSYGIQVAQLAGLPKPVLDRAREILMGLEGQAADRDNSYVHKGEILRAAARDVQLDLFAPQVIPIDPMVEDLARVEPDHLSPVQAHELLRRYAEQAKKKLEEKE